MGLQDRDYIRERAKLREEEYLRSKYKNQEKNFTDEFIEKLGKKRNERNKKAFDKFSKELSWIIIPQFLIGLIAMILLFNLLPKTKNNIEKKINPITYNKSISNTQKDETMEEEPSWICINPGTPKERCKIIEKP